MNPIFFTCVVVFICAASVAACFVYNQAAKSDQTIWVAVSSVSNGTTYSEQAQEINYDGFKVSGADVAHFLVAKSQKGAQTPYAKDNRSVYVYGRRIPNADPTTFSIIFDSDGQFTNFSKDQFHVFSIGDIEFTGSAAEMPNVSPQSFVYLNEFYIKDNEHVFDQAGNIIDGAQAATTRVMGLNSFYAEDYAHVYDVLDGFPGYVVPQARAATFVAFAVPQLCGGGCYCDAKDAKHKFLNGRVVDC